MATTYSGYSRTKQDITATGDDLRRSLFGQPPVRRGAIAAALVREKIPVSELNQEQAARLCDVTGYYVCAALGNIGKRGPRNKTIDRIIRKYGADAVMRGLDRATAPKIAAE